MIEGWLDAGRSISVFTRTSASYEMFGVAVPLYSSEEEALCVALSPLWNRARFPASTARDAGEDAEEPKTANIAPETVVDAGDLAYGDEVAAFLDSISVDGRVTFKRALQFVEARWPGKTYRVVGMYTNMPTGYSNTPMLLFADFGPAGRALPNSWVARIPLKCEADSPLTILLPFAAKQADLAPERVAEGNRAWRPLELTDFLEHPNDYLQS